MYKFEKLNPVNGFDYGNLDNARQNNYAWAISDFGDYIYVGTGRNVPLTILQAIYPDINIPEIIRPISQDNSAEIWRYKKDGTKKWQRVYKAPPNSGITGIRFMIKSKSDDCIPCLYASTYGIQVRVLKSYNGRKWFVMPYDTLEGNSSRYMVTINDELYLAVVDESNFNEKPLIYRSRDPEFYPWENITDSDNPCFNPNKNPKGEISNMAIFNNRLYVSTTYSAGVQVWRSNKKIPQMNDWTLIVDNGFGDSENQYSLSIGVFNDYLYVSGTKAPPISWALPVGFDIIRIDKYDNWELVVGGEPITPSIPSKGSRGCSISGYKSGFSNPFNVYAWQIQEYNGSLLISTLDDSSNMQIILDTILANKEYFESKIGAKNIAIIIRTYRNIICLLNKLHYPFGFDLYKSNDGVCFKPVFKNGLGYSSNYGGRVLYVSDDNELLIGTSNPFKGCQVWKEVNNNNTSDCSPRNYNKIYNRNSMYSKLIKREIAKNFKVLSDNLPIIINLINDSDYN